MLCEPPRAGLANVLWRLDFSKMKLAALLPGFPLKESRALAKLVGPALQVQKSEAGGGVICWGQKKYVWQRQPTDSFSASCARCQRLLEQRVSPGKPGLFRRTHVGVGFNVVSLLFHNATQLSLHSFKCVVDDFFQRFVSAVIHLLFIGHKLVPRRHGHVDPAPVWIPFVMVVIGLLDCDIAAVNVITKSLEPFCIIQNEIVDLVRFFQTPIRYLNRQLHNYLDTTPLFAVEGTKNLGASIPFKSAATIGNG